LIPGLVWLDAISYLPQEKDNCLDLKF